jgi:hypothetical protein
LVVSAVTFNNCQAAIFFVPVFRISSVEIPGAEFGHVGFLVTLNSALWMDQRKCKLWDKMKTANATKAVRSEEMGFKRKIEGVGSANIDTQK